MAARNHLESIIDRAVDAGLFDHRAALLRHVPNRTRGAMRLTDRPAELLRSDVTFLHALPETQIAHLIGWLKAAARLTQSATQAFFAEQARVFEDRHPPPGLRIRWRFAANTPPLGDVIHPIAAGAVILGRRHLGKQIPRFLPLISAPGRVSPRHAVVELVDDAIRIKRPLQAGMLGCDGWLKRGESRLVGRVADLDLAGALRVLVELN